MTCHVFEKRPDYKSLLEEDKVIPISCLQENRDVRATAPWKARSSKHKISELLWIKLLQRSGFQYFVVGACNHADQYTMPIVFSSDAGSDFIYQYLLFEPTMLAKHFDAFSTNNAGLKGIVDNMAAESRTKGGDKKGASSEELTGVENAHINWTKWARSEPDSHGILLYGWPLTIPPTALSNIGTYEEMEKIWQATLRRHCVFKVMAKTSNTAEKATESAGEFKLVALGLGLVLIDVHVTFSPEGTVQTRRHTLSFDDDLQEVSDNESDRPRKRTRSSGRVDDNAASSKSCGRHGTVMSGTAASPMHDSGVPSSLSLLRNTSLAPAAGAPSPTAMTFADNPLSLPAPRAHVADSSAASYQLQNMYNVVPSTETSSTSGMPCSPMSLLGDMYSATSSQAGEHNSSASGYSTPPSP
ncbi:hypothetical protein BC834DRAFT_848212 [Gloeopeniophorella convolvens]|nr:hypothetical protein BC834DRAFT_848212 [Gloeopeniophorella convolvens]